MGQLSLEYEYCGYNNNTRRIIILITDGLANSGKGGVAGLFEASREIKAKGTIIQAVTFGDDLYNVLEKMMIPPRNIYRAFKLNYLNLEKVVNTVCGSNDSRKGINRKLMCDFLNSNIIGITKDFLYYLRIFPDLHVHPKLDKRPRN